MKKVTGLLFFEIPAWKKEYFWPPEMYAQRKKGTSNPLIFLVSTINSLLQEGTFFSSLFEKNLFKFLAKISIQRVEFQTFENCDGEQSLIIFSPSFSSSTGSCFKRREFFPFWHPIRSILFLNRRLISSMVKHWNMLPLGPWEREEVQKKRLIFLASGRVLFSKACIGYLLEMPSSLLMRNSPLISQKRELKGNVLWLHRPHLSPSLSLCVWWRFSVSFDRCWVSLFLKLS